MIETWGAAQCFLPASESGQEMVREVLLETPAGASSRRWSHIEEDVKAQWHPAFHWLLGLLSISELLPFSFSMHSLFSPLFSLFQPWLIFSLFHDPLSWGINSEFSALQGLLSKYQPILLGCHLPFLILFFWSKCRMEKTLQVTAPKFIKLSLKISPLHLFVP